MYTARLAPRGGAQRDSPVWRDATGIPRPWHSPPALRSPPPPQCCHPCSCTAPASNAPPLALAPSLLPLLLLLLSLPREYLLLLQYLLLLLLLLLLMGVARAWSAPGQQGWRRMTVGRTQEGGAVGAGAQEAGEGADEVDEHLQGGLNHLRSVNNKSQETVLFK